MNALPDSNWSQDSTFSYEIDMTNETGLIDLNLEIRHAGNYPYANLFVFLSSEFPDGKGRVRKNVQFNQEGIYTMRLSHGMRQDTLEGIADIGITLFKSAVGQNLTSQPQ